MSQWKQPPLEMPLDNKVVWCRINYYFGPPFLATFTASNNNFTSNINNVVYPAWRISRWKDE